ncbi:hypothetical protein D3C77_695040 [compost metagenome]
MGIPCGEWASRQCDRRSSSQQLHGKVLPRAIATLWELAKPAIDRAAVAKNGCGLLWSVPAPRRLRQLPQNDLRFCAQNVALTCKPRTSALSICSPENAPGSMMYCTSGRSVSQGVAW